MGGIDTTVWPRTSAYLDSLPEGIDAHPACVTKASVMLAFRSYLNLDDLAGVPPAITELIDEPPLPSRWIPTVHANVVEMMVVDQVGDIPFIERALELNRDYLGSPLYRAAIRVFSPAMLLRGAAFRWGHFHRGTDLSVVRAAGSSAELRLVFPAHLFNRTIAHEKGIAFRVALEFAGGVAPRVEVAELSPTEAHYVASWR